MPLASAGRAAAPPRRRAPRHSLPWISTTSGGSLSDAETLPAELARRWSVNVQNGARFLEDHERLDDRLGTVPELAVYVRLQQTPSVSRPSGRRRGPGRKAARRLLVRMGSGRLGQRETGPPMAAG
jgi:hypothetical protein